MATYQVSLKDFAKELDKSNQQDIARFKTGVLLGLYRSMPELVKSSPVDTGQYASSWRILPMRDRVVVGNFAPHAPFIEYGVRPMAPHKPPIGPLLAWAKRVLEDPVTPRDPNDPNDYSEEVRALAFATQKKISEQGIEPKRVMQNAIPMMMENIKKELERGRN